ASINSQTNNESSFDQENERPPGQEVEGEQEEEKETHLLAPSKVVRSQELFKQIFFPTDVREKPLLSKEELAKTRNNALGAKIKAASWNESTGDDQASDGVSRVDYLSHVRR